MIDTKQRLKTVLTVRAKVLEYTRDWLEEEGFMEVQGPVLFPAFKEKSNHFTVNFFGKKAYLSGGLAPYSDTFLSLFGKIFTIAPTFRAEPIKSKRHLAEFWRIEIYSLCNFQSMMTTVERLLSHVISTLSKNEIDELTKLDSPLTNLAEVKTPFPRLTYEEAIEKLRRSGLKVFWGEPITREKEIKLTQMLTQPFFITGFPVGPETALYKSVPNNQMVTLSADLLAPESYGEIAACNELITKKALIDKRLTEMGVEIDARKWYLQYKKSKLAPQSMSTVGLERLLQWICKTDNIYETIAFPRQFGPDLR
jgi:asparaginyl-tRNA synthetase